METLKKLLYLTLLLPVFTYAQNVARLDGSKIDVNTLTSNISMLMDKAKVTGLAISVINRNRPIYIHTFGQADAPNKKALETSQVFYAGSLSKAVFAYIVMQLVEEKVLDLDKPLVSYLPKQLPEYIFNDPDKGYAQLKEDLRYRKITARMCLDHTTGLPNWRWFEPGEKLTIKFEPGSRYSYSGEGLYLLQFVIEQFTGKDLETLARARVFGPLGMSNTSYVWRDDFATHLVLGHDPEGKPYKFKHRTAANAAGSMCTTLEDYTKFFAALLRQKGLSKIVFNEMTRPQVRIYQIKQFGPLSRKDSTLNDAVQLSYGLGFGSIKTPAGPAFFKECHDNGWQHYSIGYPQKGIAVVIMSNSDNAEGIFKALLEITIKDKWSPWYWENYIPVDLADVH